MAVMSVSATSAPDSTVLLTAQTPAGARVITLRVPGTEPTTIEADHLRVLSDESLRPAPTVAAPAARRSAASPCSPECQQAAAAAIAADGGTIRRLPITALTIESRRSLAVDGLRRIECSRCPRLSRWAGLRWCGNPRPLVWLRRRPALGCGCILRLKWLVAAAPAWVRRLPILRTRHRCPEDRW